MTDNIIKAARKVQKSGPGGLIDMKRLVGEDHPAVKALSDLIALAGEERILSPEERADAGKKFTEVLLAINEALS